MFWKSVDAGYQAPLPLRHTDAVSVGSTYCPSAGYSCHQGWRWWQLQFNAAFVLLSPSLHLILFPTASPAHLQDHSQRQRQQPSVDTPAPKIMCSPVPIINSLFHISLNVSPSLSYILCLYIPLLLSYRKPQREINLPRIPQLISGGTRFWTQSIWFQNPSL